MKKFLQEGLQIYAPALLALSEFRRQVRSRLQNVLDDFSAQLSDVGLSSADLRPNGTKLDDEELARKTSWIGLRKSSAQLYTGYYVEWDLEEPKGQQLWVAANVWVGTRSNRDRLFRALQKQHSSTTDLEQSSEGSSVLSAYCDPDLFYRFDEMFRTLVEEWVGLLSAVGGIQSFISATGASPLQQDAEA